MAEARSVRSTGSSGVLRGKPVRGAGQQPYEEFGRGERSRDGRGSEPYALGGARPGDSAGLRRVARGAGGDARVLERVRRAAHDLRRLRGRPARVRAQDVGVVEGRGRGSAGCGPRAGRPCGGPVGRRGVGGARRRDGGDGVEHGRRDGDGRGARAARLERRGLVAHRGGLPYDVLCAWRGRRAARYARGRAAVARPASGRASARQRARRSGRGRSFRAPDRGRAGREPAGDHESGARGPAHADFGARWRRRGHVARTEAARGGLCEPTSVASRFGDTDRA